MSENTIRADHSAESSTRIGSIPITLTPGGQKTSALARCGLILFGTLTALFFAEIAFRLSGIDPTFHPPRSDRPSMHYFPSDAPSTRDYHYSFMKPPGTFRIAVVGDSFTFGVKILFDDTFPKRLERLLNLNANAPKLEVLNYGVPGFSTVQEEALARNALARGSDLIVLQITLNDAEIFPYHRTHRTFDQPLDWSILRYWKSLAFALRRIRNTLSFHVDRDYYFHLFDDPDKWQRFRVALKTILAAAEAHHAKLVAVVFPLFSRPLDMSYPFTPLHKKITDELTHLEIPNLDLFSAYEGLDYVRLQIEPGIDSHPNEIAHRIAAETMYPWLVSRGLVPAENIAVETSPDRSGSADVLLRVTRSAEENDRNVHK